MFPAGYLFWVKKAELDLRPFLPIPSTIYLLIWEPQRGFTCEYHLYTRSYICDYLILKIKIWNYEDLKVKLLSRVWLFAAPWTVAYEAPLSMEFSRQERWSGLPYPSPGDLPDPGLLHGRQTLYHLSHQGSPMKT